ALRDVIARTRDGDPGFARVVADAGAVIAAGVAGLGTAGNPQCGGGGGELSEAGEALRGPLREAVRRRVLLKRIAPLEVVPAALGQRAEVMGALLLALASADVPAHVDDDRGAGGAGDQGEQGDEG